MGVRISQMFDLGQKSEVPVTSMLGLPVEVDMVVLVKEGWLALGTRFKRQA